MNVPQVVYESGWYPEEEGGGRRFRWMQRSATCTLAGLPTKGRRELIIIIGGYPFGAQPPPRLKVSVGTRVLGEVEITPDSWTYPFPLKNKSAVEEIRLELDRAIVADDDQERRELGMMIEEMRVHSERMPTPPDILELEITTYCNVNPPCVSCYPRIFDKRGLNSFFDEGTLEELLPHLEGLRRVSLHGVGEAFVGPALFRMLDRIDTESTEVQFTTNALLMTEQIADELISKNLKLIDISLDAATPETFLKIRRSNFALVMKNIKGLAEAKRRRGVDHPVIRLNMTLMNENLKELVPFVEMASRLGAQIVLVRLLHPYKEYEVESSGFVFNYKDQMIDTSTEEFTRTVEQARQTAERLSIELVTHLSTYYQ